MQYSCVMHAVICRVSIAVETDTWIDIVVMSINLHAATQAYVIRKKTSVAGKLYKDAVVL